MELIIGVIGMGFILLGFVLNEITKHFDKDSKHYNLLNLVGALLLIYYAYAIASWPFLILNSVWALTAIWKLDVLFLKKK